MPERARLLVVDDDASLAEALAGLLRHAGHEVRTAGTGPEALAAAEADPADLVLLDLRLGATSGLELLPRIKALRPEAAVVMISAVGTIETAVEAMRLGADNFVTKPLEPPRLLAVVERAVETARLRRRSEQLARLATSQVPGVTAASASMRQVLGLVEAVAGRDTTVLLTGETGTGKGLLARTIHDRSSRRRRPFVELNCAGLQRELTESELFGHERGAFTGASERKLGLFEAADGGTLFLDEIGEMDIPVQAKLLKVLESRRFRRLGGVSEIEVDVRLVAATHRDLEADAEAGRFRRDLLYRLNVFTVPIPPLRERRDDIVPLARRFLTELRPQGGALSPAAEAVLAGYGWPGNARELRNVVERAAILCPEGADIGPGHLPNLPGSGGHPPEPPPAATLEDAERRAVAAALATHGGNIKAAAAALGVSRGTLYRKIRKFGLEAR